MAEEVPNNVDQNLSEYTNLDTNLSTSEDAKPFAGINDLSSNTYGLGVSNKLDMPGPAIMNNIVGVPDQIPGGKAIQNNGSSLKEYIAAQSQGIADAENQSTYGKMFNYDAGPDGANFYDRYAAYGSDKFDEVGFHPFRDNQANFNANTTLWNDMSIMLRDSFPTLLKRGFIDGPKSFAKMLSGDFRGADLEDAEEYERAAAMGQSTRGGVGAFFNNAFMNFGYTAGIITEAIAEEFALSFMTVGSGGATGGLQAVRTAHILDDIGKGLGKVKTGANTLEKLAKVSKNPAAARTFWETSMGKKTSALGRLVNPLENTTDALRGIGKVGKAGKGAAYLEAMAKLSATPGAFYRDVRNINMAISESRLEAGMVENKIFNKLYDDYFLEFKKVPDANEQYAMRQQAKKGSLETFNANAGIIYLTNQMTFGNIVRPKGGLNNFLKQTRKEIYEVAAKSGEKQFGSLGKVLYDNTKKAFVFEKNNLKNLAKSWWKQPGYDTAKKTLGYFKSNVSEGFQENLQEVIARANEAHYVEAYKQQAPASSLYAKGVNKMSYKIQMGIDGSTPLSDYGKELRKEFSTLQGFETFMSGFMMGTFAAPLNKAMPFLATQKARIFNKEDYKQWKETKLEVTKGIVDNLNEINIDQLINSRLMNLGTQEKVSEIQTKGSKKEALDAEVDSFVATMSLMRRTGTTEVFIDKLKSFQEMSDSELLNAVKSLEVENVPKYRERINNAVTKLKSIEKKFKQADELFENPADISNMSPEQMATTEGRALERLHNAWNKSIENFVYLNEAFEDTTKRMSSITNTYLSETSLGTASYGAVKVLFQPQNIGRQIGILEQEVAVTEQADNVSKENKSKVKNKKKQIEALKEFQTSQALFYGFYQRNETPTLNLARKRLKTEDNIDNPSEEQIQQKLSELLGDITDEKKQLEVTKNLKTAHDKYIRIIAEDNDATVFNTNLDKAFNDLTDFYKLEYEKRAVAEHIDLLTDPGEFLKLVLENEKAFDRLDLLKNELNSQVVDEQVNKVALDQLLNDLANQGPPLYMDQDQVIDVLKNKKVPEFFTGLKDEVYESGSENYKKGKERVEQYITLSKILTSNVDETTGIEMTAEMKKSVDQVKEVFKNSENIGAFKGFYLEEGSIHSRVSNVMNKLFEDKQYNRLDTVLASMNNVFIEDSGSFVFNETNINAFIDELERDVNEGAYGANLGGITEETLQILKTELNNLLNGEILSSVQKQIDELEQGKTKYEGSLVAVDNIRLIDEEIEKLKSKSISEEDLTIDVVEDVLTNVLPQITYEGGRVRGLSLDDMVRDFFDPGSQLLYENYKDKISEQAFIGLFGPEGHLAKLKQRADAGEIYIFSKNLKIADNALYDKEGNKINNVAGALDLIIVDKTGKKYIVDLKTGSLDKWDKYLIPGDKNFNYKKYVENSMQQRAYANLFFNKSNGEDVETLILPIAVSEDKSGYITQYEEIPDRSFRSQKPIENLVDGYMFMKTDNKAKFKVNDSKIKVTDIDEYVPRKSIAKIEPILESAKSSISLSELDALEREKKSLEEEIKSLKRSSAVDKTELDEVQDNLKEVNQKISGAKRTPDEEEKLAKNEESKEFYKDLRSRRNIAEKNIIQTIGGLKDRIFIETEYINNEGIAIKIKKEALIKGSLSNNNNAIQSATDSVIIRINQLYRYDIEKYKRKPLIENTVDNLTGRLFRSEIGKIYDVELDQYGEEGAVQNIKIDAVYITEDDNYGILATNLKSDKLYDMVVTPEGDVLQHNNRGAKGDSRANSKIFIDDVIFFEDGDFARKKTEEDKPKEKDPANIVIKQETVEQEDSDIKLTTTNLSTLQLALDGLNADLEFEKGEFGNPDNVSLIEAQIKVLTDEIERIKKLTDVKTDKVDDARTPVKNELGQLIKDINNESKTNTLEMYEMLDEFYNTQTYKLSDSLYKELKVLLDSKANVLLDTTNLIESGNIYTFKEALDSKKIKMGDEIRVQKLDSSNKKIIGRKIGKEYSEPLSLTLSEFESKIDFGDTPPPPTDSSQDEIIETGDILKDFLNNKNAQESLDKSEKDFFDETNDNDIFNNCKT